MQIKNDVVVTSKYKKISYGGKQINSTSNPLMQLNYQTTPLKAQSLRGVGLGELSFKASQLQTDYVIEKAKINKKNIMNTISEILEKDRDIISSAFWGEVTEETKFSKPGWYLSIKNNHSLDDNNIVSDMNPRKFVRLYNDIYNNQLVSVHDVAKGNKKYLDEQTNIDIKSAVDKNKNLDEYIVNKIDKSFAAVSQKKEPVLTVSDKAIVDEKKQVFFRMFHPNPLYMKPENVLEFLRIIDSVLDNVDNKTYNKICSDMYDLYDSLVVKDKDKMLQSFDSLQKEVLPVWEEQILTKQVLKEEEQQKMVSEFINSSFYNSINYDGKMGLIFVLPFFSLDEKAFLSERANVDLENNRPTTTTFLDFIRNTVVEDDKRRVIVQRVMEAVDIAEENFDAMKETFISDVRNQDKNSIIHSKKLDGVSILERVLDKLPLDDRHSLVVLNELTDEDLHKLLDEIKPLWIDEKYKEACKTEELKYDISDNFESVMSKLVLEVDGKEVGINEFLQDSFKDLFKQTDILQKNSEQALKDLYANYMLLLQHDMNELDRYTAIMEQLARTQQYLEKHSKESTELFVLLAKELDKIEQMFPGHKKEIRYTRTNFEKLKDGLINERNLIPFAFGAMQVPKVLAVTKAATVATAASGGLLVPIVLLSLYGLMIANNVRKEFKKP